jgi:hypothetical protein
VRRGLLVLAASAALASAAAAQGGAPAAPLTVGVDRTEITTQLGHKFHFRSTFRNAGATAADGRIAHLNILSLHSDVYVDPEDWSSHRTKFLPTIPAGGSVTVNWPMEAVNHGSFDVYVTLITPDASGKQPAIGPAVHIAVADRKTLNSGGILPLALGIPAALGLLTLGLRYRRRQR